MQRMKRFCLTKKRWRSQQLSTRCFSSMHLWWATAQAHGWASCWHSSTTWSGTSRTSPACRSSVMWCPWCLPSTRERSFWQSSKRWRWLPCGHFCRRSASFAYATLPTLLLFETWRFVIFCQDWDSEHEVAWGWLWENIEGLLGSMLGLPAWRIVFRLSEGCQVMRRHLQLVTTCFAMLCCAWARQDILGLWFRILHACLLYPCRQTGPARKGIGALPIQPQWRGKVCIHIVDLRCFVRMWREWRDLE